MLSKIVHFFFGTPPDIFDSKGRVVHKLPKEKWDAWKKNYHDKSHNWKKHNGTCREKH